MPGAISTIQIQNVSRPVRMMCQQSRIEKTSERPAR